MLISKGATYYDKGLYLACINGHKDIVQLMIQKGANNLTSAFHSACFGGNIDIVQLLIYYGADDWNEGLTYRILQ